MMEFKDDDDGIVVKLIIKGKSYDEVCEIGKKKIKKFFTKNGEKGVSISPIQIEQIKTNEYEVYFRVKDIVSKVNNKTNKKLGYRV